MNFEQAISFAVLIGSLAFFVWGRWRYDLVAAGALVVVAATGLVTPAEALGGFGHPAVITVAAVLVISRALINSGLIDEIRRHLLPFTENLALHIISLSTVCAIASAFINNVGAIAIMLPVALMTCAERGRAPALVLMPLAFGSILGGLMTLIGTPPNIIIATFRGELNGTEFGMFDFSLVGIPVAFLGILFTALIGWRLVPQKRRGTKNPDQLFQIEAYITEVRVINDGPLIGKRYGDMEQEIGEDVVVTGLLRADGKMRKPARREFVREGDVLILKADPKDLKPIMDQFGLELYGTVPQKLEELEPDNIKLYEAIVSPGSLLESRSPTYLRRRSGYTLHLLAIAREGEPIRKRLKDVAFRSGDVLLMQGDQDSTPDTLAELKLLPLPERGLKLGKPRKIWLALGIFTLAILASAFGYLSLPVAFIAAIGAFVMTGILPTRELYSYIDWPIIVLLGAMIPVGQALQSTGSTDLIAAAIVAATSSLPIWVMLALIMAVTMTLSDLVNNAATALIMAPIAVSIANTLGHSVDPYLMTVAVGASCAFLTPIGHQSNTLVMGPAGYHFSDYWRMGLPLEIIILFVSIPLIMWWWPLILV